MIVDKLWGYESVIVNNDLYCGKVLTVLDNGKCCSIHYHKEKTETFYVIEGSLVIMLATRKDKLSESIYDFNDPIIRILDVGDSVTVHPYTAHRFFVYNPEVLLDYRARFIEFSTTDYGDDSIRLIESGDIDEHVLDALENGHKSCAWVEK
jgi:mannose-6-phosphate isomerase-like protein (cupin superfamily)